MAHHVHEHHHGLFQRRGRRVPTRRLVPEEEGRLPACRNIFAWGDHRTIEGIFHADEKTASALSTSQSRTGCERVAIEFDHATVAAPKPTRRSCAAADRFRDG